MPKSPLLQIKNYLKKSFFYNHSSISLNRKIEQLGLNYMEYNEVIVQLENYNEIVIPDASLNIVVTIGDLVKLVNHHRKIGYLYV